MTIYWRIRRALRQLKDFTLFMAYLGGIFAPLFICAYIAGHTIVWVLGW